MNAKKFTQTFNGTVEWIFPGGFFKLLSAAPAVDVELIYGGRATAKLDSVDAGTYLRAPFEVIRITTSGSQTVTFLAAPDEGGSDRLTIDNLQANTLTNEATATVGVAAASVLAASAARKVIYFRARTGNTADIILGASGVTVNGAIRLAAGTEKTVEVAAPAQWFGISTAAGQNLDILTGS